MHQPDPPIGSQLTTPHTPEHPSPAATTPNPGPAPGGSTFPPDARDLLAGLGLGSSTTGGIPAATTWPEGLPSVPGYEVTGEIARGGMGRVLAARDVALGREVAVKMLLPGRTAADAGARFVREAVITARLPHPGIPPVHQLGTLADGSPFLAMKLINGRTLDRLLADRPSPSDQLPRWVRVFEQVCQAVGFAHSQGIIHRDLKPLNVMVGAFGEVQVMDWGLAKIAGSAEDLGAAGPGVVRCGEGDTDAPHETRAGSVLGTPAYMPPEQARGELERVGPRSDVFALGGMLCAVLTGRPVYTGLAVREVWLLASEADLAGALARLDACGADAELVALAKQCLAPDPADRPAEAGAVAALVAEYRAGVEGRLRAAELEAARAVSERRKRTWQLAAAAALGLLVTAGGGFAWWQDRRAEQDRAESFRRRLAEEQREQAEQARLGRNAEQVEESLVRCDAALARGDTELAELELGSAERQATGGGADHLRDRLRARRRHVALLVRIDEFHALPVVADDPSERSAQEAARWAEALAEVGITPETAPAEAARTVAESPARESLLYALDQWSAVSRDGKILPLLRAADPDQYRNDVRLAALGKGNLRLTDLLDREEATAQPVWFAVTLARGASVLSGAGIRILAAAAQAHPDDPRVMVAMVSAASSGTKIAPAERLRWCQAALALRPRSPLSWISLGSALQAAGDRDGARAAYQEAIRLRPAYAPGHLFLAKLYTSQKDVPAALASYREAFRLRQDGFTFIPFWDFLRRNGYEEEARAAYARVSQVRPRDAMMIHTRVAHELLVAKDYDGAVEAGRLLAARAPKAAASFLGRAGRELLEAGEIARAAVLVREAAALDPASSTVQSTLGRVLEGENDSAGAEEAFRAAARLDPKSWSAHHNLGLILKRNGKPAEAEQAFREAVRLNPKDAKGQLNLGLLLGQKRDHAGAAAAFREAVRLDPKNAVAHNNLGIALRALGDLAGAVAAYREAVRLDPKNANAHNSLGAGLAARGEFEAAIECFRQALRIDPKHALARKNLDLVTRQKADRDARAGRIAPPPREVRR